MVLLINESQLVGVIINAMTTEVTGSDYLTLLVILFLCLNMMVAMNVPVDVAILFLVPMVIVFSIFTSNFLLLAGLVLIYLAYIVVDYWFG